jgi:hypothetical protein
MYRFLDMSAAKESGEFGVRLRKALLSALLLGSNFVLGTSTRSYPKDDSISKRVAAVRKSLSETQEHRALSQTISKPREADVPVQMAQFWGNWPNWANWANWANWRNF